MTAIYAHRGNTTGLPAPVGAALSGGGRPEGGTPARENTLAAFAAARRAGADGVELDVRLSADGVPVIHHDRRLPDGCDIANIAWRELPGDVPTLDEALDVCGGLSVNIEIKHEEGACGTAAAAAVLADRRDRQAPRSAARPARRQATSLPPVLVSSFHERCLTALSGADVPLGLLVDWRTSARTGLARATALGCATLHPFVSQVDADLVTAAAGAGIGLHVWTVNADADLAAMATLGVAAVITDRVVAAVPIVRGMAGAFPGSQQ
jgi:glycerophosphoryl diester phosphodiesterase